MYRDCADTLGLLNETEFLTDRVKYYAHNPNCWMVIVDNMAYFEPYTFGQPIKGTADNRRFGPYMPVFRFGKGSLSGTFEMLRRHFEKLWDTSDAAHDHLDDRWQNRLELGRKILKGRERWFAHVHRALTFAASRQKERRRWPRRTCDERVSVQLHWKGLDNPPTEAEVIESSAGGLGLKPCQGTRIPKPGERVTLSAKARPGNPVTRSMLQRYEGKSFDVAEALDDRICLQLVKTAGAKTAGA